mgnify:CR=1 FL=1|tara:strand:+ start:2013 stop:2786 length:774 start_codon:yes stop_codon:yes gene_type:complete
MDVFINRRASMCASDDQGPILSSIDALIKLGYADHKCAVHALCKTLGGDISLTILTRNDVLNAIRLELNEACAICQHEYAPLLMAHVAFVDSRPDAQYPDVVAPLRDDTIHAIGGDDVLNLMREYTAVRYLLDPAPTPVEIFDLSEDDSCDNAVDDDSVHDCTTKAQPLSSDDIYEDADTPSFIRVNDHPSGNFTLRTIMSNENDTAVNIARHFHCTIDKLQELNDTLRNAGFFTKGARLKKNTTVYVADYRDHCPE